MGWAGVLVLVIAVRAYSGSCLHRDTSCPPSLPSLPSAALKSPRKAKLGRNKEEGSGVFMC